ncbi:MAG: hypothetical protein RSF77_04390 [Oscillospiraceae bacterium]
MKNNQLLPFERNRYYVGKLLTSADFQVEQIYGNQKRRFLNKLMYGSGIVCGLSVYSLDDVSIMLESGAAIDGWGREVVVENAAMKKLAAISGFETLATNHAVLCLRYEEEAVYPVYAISSGDRGESYEYNRVREGYSLCLRDRDTLPKIVNTLEGFLSTATLYEDSDYSVTLTLPSVMGCGQPVRLVVKVTQLSDTQQPLSMQAALQIPALQTADGDHVCNIEFDSVLPGDNNSFTREYFLTAGLTPVRDSVLMVPSGGLKVKIGDSSKSLDEQFMFKVAVEQLSNDNIITRSIGAVSLEEMDLESRPELIELAEFKLQRTKNAYLIEEVIENGVKNYIETSSAAPLRVEREKWLPAPGRVGTEHSTQESQNPEAATKTRNEPIFATGVCEIPIPVNAKADQIIFSDEIVHGLGNCPLNITVGLEYFSEDKKLGATSRSTIFGDPKLFSVDASAVPPANLAVKVMNDRGSFVVAARLAAPTPMVILTVRWNAIAFPLGEEDVKLRKIEGKSIAAVRPTAVMATRESHYFSVNFKNMQPCTLTYELTEKDSGQITSDGIYTAPGKEGIFEIRISCADLPMISTYAYAVVKKRNADDKDEIKE